MKVWFGTLDGDGGCARATGPAFDDVLSGGDRSKRELFGEVGDMVSGVVAADQADMPSAVAVQFDTAELVLLSLPRLCEFSRANCMCCARASAGTKLPYRL